jgi:hypothetical protein
MFSSISWSEFINAALWLVGVYYTVSIPFLYRKEIFQRLTSHNSSNPESIDEPVHGFDSLMGRVSPGQVPNKRTVTADEILIESQASNDSFETEQFDDISSDKIIAELLTEIKVLAKVNKESDPKLDEILSTLSDLLFNYSHVSQSTRTTINQFISEQYKTQCGISLAEDDLKTIWPS